MDSALTFNTPGKVKVVVATRHSQDDFFKATATGRSFLAQIDSTAIELVLFANNTQGLPSVYNQVIEACRHAPAPLVFMHDDLLLLDFYWVRRVLAGLTQFPILGIVGSTRRLDKQSSWFFQDPACQVQELPEYLSGHVALGSGFPAERLAIYGPPGQAVKWLDGLMLCAHSDTLIANDIRFDERFDFHFYDMDFCRQAEAKQVVCGTWPISLVHESYGSAIGSDGWASGYQRYLEKWGN